METSDDSYSVQRNDHDYYGNSEETNGSRLPHVSSSENVDGINDMLMESTESEKQTNEQNFVMIEEVVESSTAGCGDIEESAQTDDEPMKESVVSDGKTGETLDAARNHATEASSMNLECKSDAEINLDDVSITKKLVDSDAESKYKSDDLDSSFSAADELIEGSELSTTNHADHSTMSTMSDDSNGDEPYVSDVSSTVAENETPETFSSIKTASSKSRKRAKQSALMMGYKKRRKTTHAKKYDDESCDSVSKLPATSENSPVDTTITSETEGSVDDKSESLRKSLETSPAEENVTDNWARSNYRKYSSTGNEMTDADKFCWFCHKDGNPMLPNTVLKCIACPRVFHTKCLQPSGYSDSKEDPSNFHCPECSAVLKADNVNTRSPVLVSVNLDQLCTLLKHIIDILKSQKESYYFWGPVDTKEFPHYRDYVVYPMDLSVLEKNVKNKVYGCTEAFLADVKWIVHNSIVFNSQAAKITNVAKNLLKICKREIFEIETCAECYYNSLVRKDTWFIEVCKKPHILVWARLKGYPPWPAKAMRCRDSMVDCRFFGAHDKAWVPLKDCFLYSKNCPQPVKVKKGSHLEGGIQELEKHIKKLKDKYGTFTYPDIRIPYRPSEEFEQLRMMLPNYNPRSSVRPTKYLIPSDRVKSDLKPKVLFEEEKPKSGPAGKEESESNEIDKTLDEVDGESVAIEDMDKLPETASHDESGDESSSANSSESEAPSVKEGGNVEQLEKSVEPCPSAEETQSKENPNGNSSIADRVPSVATSPPVQVQKIEAETSAEKTEDVSATTVRKLVSVKNIESINATVATTSSSTVKTDSHSKNASPELTVTTLATAGKQNTPKAATSGSVVHAQTIEATSTKEAVNPKSVPQESKTSEKTAAKSISVDTDSSFSLDKVKDEPVDNTMVQSNEGDKFEKMIVESPLPPKIDVRKLDSAAVATPTVNSSLKVKKPSELEEDSSSGAKKIKPDTNCRTVNITENVTLSLINQSASDTIKSPRVVNLNSKPAKVQKMYQPFTAPGTRLVYSSGSGSNLDGGGGMRSKLVPVSGVATGATNAPRVQSKAQNRIVTNMPHANGSVSGPIAKNAMTLIAPGKSASKTIPENNDSVGKMLDECASECQIQIRKMLENALEKLAGKGDLRARIISLKKEIETLKRNHELTIDEMKRDYELQIAELRATSIAKTQFDLAAERLRFEQEKERAVKEAKSKQWCSNCQKTANYYCCWNTAYCDFNCQKDHWIQHMYVCKNDVKKKAAESSENEPPRIMMQNEDTDNYLRNGFDKPNSTFTFANTSSGATGHSRNNFHRVQTKTTNTSRSAPRPLLPRVTTVISNSPTSSSLSGGSCVVGNSQSTFLEPSVYQNATSNSSPTLRPSVYTTTVNSFVRHSPQFHK